MVHPASCGVPRAPHYSGKPPRESQTFHLRGYHTLWLVFPDHSVKFDFGNSPRDIGIPPTIPHNTLIATPQRLTPLRFELIPVRSPLLRKSRLISSPPGTEMVHFPGSRLPLCGMIRYKPYRVPPFGNPRINACLRLPVAYRSKPRPSSLSCAKASTVRP